MARCCCAWSFESGAMTSASLPIATAIDRSVARNCRRKRLGGCLRQAERIAGHAPAPVDAQHHRQRELPCGKGGDLLRILILLNLEIFPLQASDEAPISIGHGCVDLDQLNACRELRNRLLQHSRPGDAAAGHTDDTENGCARVVQICRRKESMGNLGIPELLIILCIIILVFGANRLP